MLKTLKLKTIALILGIVLTFGLIAAAAPNLPADAQTIVTTEQEDDDDGRRGDRDGRRGDRQRGSDRGPRVVDDFFDF